MSGGLDFYQILLHSGIVVKIVLLILVSLSVLSWAIIIQKKKNLKLVKKQNDLFLEIFNNEGTLKETEAKMSQCPESIFKKMFENAMKELNKITEIHGAKTTDFLKSGGIESLERSLKQGANNSNLELDNRLSTLASVSSVAPFVGLFGTVWGIIDAFSGLASGGGSIEAVAPGIAEALVATAVGLAAAIPANWFFNIFSTDISRMNVEMENFGEEFLKTIERTF